MRDLDVEIAERVMGWTRFEGSAVPESITWVSKNTGWEHRERVWASKEADGSWKPEACEECGTMPLFSTEIESAMLVVERLTKAGIEVLMGCFPIGYAIELRAWRDRRTEGIPGDPDTGRSRETFVCMTGESNLPRAICEAALRPETLVRLKMGQ